MPAARPAMEVYAAGTLLDVVVATSMTRGILRGAWRGAYDGQACTLAWGCLPADGSGVTVEFAPGRLCRAARSGLAACSAEVIPVAGRFWLARAEGRFSAVRVSYHGVAQRRAIRDLRRW